MNIKLIALIIVIAAAAVGAVVLVNGSHKSANTTSVTTPTSTPGCRKDECSHVTQGPSATVVFQNGQFTPKTITIKVGQSVSFLNMSNSQIQVASDPHPTHTNLKGFQSNNLDKDDAYLFIFLKAGTWGYHDHLNPSNTGTVIVQ